MPFRVDFSGLHEKSKLIRRLKFVQYIIVKLRLISDWS